MPIPVPNPGTPSPVTDDRTLKAEALLAEFIRIMKFGTTGGTPSVQTPASLIPLNPDTGVLVPVDIDTKEKQLFFRQIFLAIAQVVPEWVVFPPTPAPSYFRTFRLLSGVSDGVNTVFTTPEKFIFNPPVSEAAVYYDGRRMARGGDYSVSESGGVGTGYDTITFLFAPKPGDALWADYLTP